MASMIYFIVLMPERPYILADDFCRGYGIRLAVVRRLDNSPAGYLLKTEGGCWKIETAHLSYKMADENDPMNRVYQNPNDAAVLVYMCGRAYRKSYTVFGDPSRGLEIVVTLIAGLWVASVREREEPYKLVVPSLFSPSLEEAKYMALQKAHYVLFEQDGNLGPTGHLRSFEQEEWDDIELPQL
jgi:hypothetical protein